LKKEKRKSKKLKKVEAKKQRYAEFEKSREKRIQQRIEQVSKIPTTENWELQMKNDNLIADFFRKQKKLREG
jgi:hypothetical protein